MLRTLRRLATARPVPFARTFASQDTTLPEHIKFRLPNLDFDDIVDSTMEKATLTKWFVKEGDYVRDGDNMCEIDTPDLVFTLDAGDEGYIAKLVVATGATDVPPSQTLAVIVPKEEDIQAFQLALTANPEALKGYQAELEGTPAMVETASDEVEGAEILRVLHALKKEGYLSDEKEMKVLKSLARKNDRQLLVTYQGSFSGDTRAIETFDKDFFVENARELVQEQEEQ